MRFRPAPLGAWVGVKLRLVRFRSCAWLCRVNDPGPFSAVGAHSVRPLSGLEPAPTERPESFPYFVGAAHWAARQPSPSKGEGRFPLSGGNGRRPKGVGGLAVRPDG